jgi:hypothetical protein
LVACGVVELVRGGRGVGESEERKVKRRGM